jgi:hypothetical protein
MAFTHVNRASVMVAMIVGTMLSAAVAAQDHAADEAAIRALVGQMDGGKRVPQMQKRVFWSGAYEKPALDGERPTPRKGEGGVDSRVANSQRTKTEIRRIVVSDAGDMAYEYSDVDISFDLKAGGHQSFTNSTLRVWQKDGSQWKLAASFSFPHERD